MRRGATAVKLRLTWGHGDPISRANESRSPHRHCLRAAAVPSAAPISRGAAEVALRLTWGRGDPISRTNEPQRPISRANEPRRNGSLNDDGVWPRRPHQPCLWGAAPRQSNLGCHGAAEVPSAVPMSRCATVVALRLTWGRSNPTSLDNEAQRFHQRYLRAAATNYDREGHGLSHS